MRSLKAVVTDLDGTLMQFTLDYLALRAKVRELLTLRGLSNSLISSKDNMFQMLDKATVYLRNKGRDETEVQTLHNVVFALADQYELNAAQQTSLIPGAKETLQALREMHLKLGLFTTGGIKSTLYVLSKFNLSRFFDVIATRETVPKVKPNPAHLFTVINSLNVAPKEVLVVGDSESDVHCAKASETLAVGVGTGFSSLENLRRTGADYVIPSIFDLPSLIKCIQQSP